MFFRYSGGPLTLFTWLVDVMRPRRVERAHDRRRELRESPIERRSGRDRRLAHN